MKRGLASLLLFALVACQSGESVEFADASIILPEDDTTSPCEPAIRAYLKATSAALR